MGGAEATSNQRATLFGATRLFGNLIGLIAFLCANGHFKSTALAVSRFFGRFPYAVNFPGSVSVDALEIKSNQLDSAVKSGQTYLAPLLRPPVCDAVHIGALLAFGGLGTQLEAVPFFHYRSIG